jgi:hypothetical protein
MGDVVVGCEVARVSQRTPGEWGTEHGLPHRRVGKAGVPRSGKLVSPVGGEVGLAACIAHNHTHHTTRDDTLTSLIPHFSTPQTHTHPAGGVHKCVHVPLLPVMGACWCVRVEA